MYNSLNKYKCSNSPDPKTIKNKAGFTLIELLLVILIFTVLAATAYPIGSNSLSKNDFINKTDEIYSTVKTAQLNSMIGKEDSSWGMAINSDNIILFKGESFAIRDSAFDEKYTIPATLAITPSEFVFAKITGNPISSGNIIVTANNGDSITLFINEVGNVDVN